MITHDYSYERFVAVGKIVEEIDGNRLYWWLSPDNACREYKFIQKFLLASKIQWWIGFVLSTLGLCAITWFSIKALAYTTFLDKQGSLALASIVFVVSLAIFCQMAKRYSELWQIFRDSYIKANWDRVQFFEDLNRLAQILSNDPSSIKILHASGMEVESNRAPSAIRTKCLQELASRIRHSRAEENGQAGAKIESGKRATKYQYDFYVRLGILDADLDPLPGIYSDVDAQLKKEEKELPD